MKHVAKDEAEAVVTWWVEQGEDGPQLVCQSSEDDNAPWTVARLGTGQLVLVGDIENNPNASSFCDLAVDGAGFIKVSKGK